MTTDTRQRILDAARLTVQASGYAGLSFRELAKDVGIKSASIHHYFPTKGGLGGALADRYTSDFAAYLETVFDASEDPADCIRKYADVFRNTLTNGNRMCLGGILAAEHSQLPDEVKTQVVAFTEMNVAWLTRVLSRGRRSRDPGTVGKRATAIFAAVEGAQLLARARADLGVYDEIIDAYRVTGLLP